MRITLTTKRLGDVLVQANAQSGRLLKKFKARAEANDRDFHDYTM